MDILAELRRALAEVRARMGGRKSQKKKKVRAPGRPAKTGRKTGCGTGAGGFGEGNDCAKEDGRPNMPKSFAQKGKQATAASLPATKEALVAKAAALEGMAKNAKISSARKKAAIRKKEKQVKETAEKQAADAARAKKRAEMLQKIRIKKANEKLQVDGKDFGLPKQEKPASPFSGKGDETAVRRQGELETEFLKRKHQKDLDAYHAEAAKIEAKYEKEISEANRESSKAETIYKVSGDQAALEKHKAEKARAAEAKSKMDSELHDLIGKFTLAHAGGLANTRSLDSSPDVYLANAIGVSKNAAQAARAEISKAWAWLSRVAAKKHESRILNVKVKLRPGGGGSHQAMNGQNEATIGADARASSVRKTTVHEYGHAIESASPGTLKALEEDYLARLSDFRASNAGARTQGIPGTSYYDSIYKAGEKVGSFNIDAPSYLGYARRYSDAGFKDSAIAQYANHPDKARMNKGTEVFSTGIESLYREPSEFRRRARHGHDVAMLILAGIL